MKILIIEDDKNIASVLEQFLQPISAHITIAYTMEQALKVVTEADDVELITLDLGLPDSAIESTLRQKVREIRAIRPNSLIILVTGNAIEGLEETAIQEGADGVILKQQEDFTQKGFLTVIAKIVEKYMTDPQPPHRSISLLEKVSNRIAKYNVEAAAAAHAHSA